MQSEVRGFVRDHKDVQEMSMPGGARIRWLITHRDNAPNFSMRLITVEKGKSTPYHLHDYEHEMYIISGSGEITIGDKISRIKPDSFVFVPPNIYHGMTAESDMKLICIVPIKAAKEALGP
ncbi:MAG: cupin domain-containing protein [Thermoplasmataceae archaeon]